jgi:hypothetical protein
MSILWCGTFGPTLMAVSDDIDPPTDKTPHAFCSDYTRAWNYPWLYDCTAVRFSRFGMIAAICRFMPETRNARFSKRR